MRLIKPTLQATFLMMLLATMAAGQSVFAIERVLGKPTVSAEITGTTRAAITSRSVGDAKPTRACLRDTNNNPYIGGKVGYKFTGTNQLGDSVLATVQILQKIDFGDTDTCFSFPIRGNISPLITAVTAASDGLEEKAKELINSSSGALVGLFPSYVVLGGNDSGRVLHVSLEGEASWKVNGYKLADKSTEYLQQGRFSFGPTIAIGLPTADHQLFLTMHSTVTALDAVAYKKVFGVSRTSIVAGDFSLVLPVGKGVGFLLERSQPTKGKASLSAGLVLVAK